MRSDILITESQDYAINDSHNSVSPGRGWSWNNTSTNPRDVPVKEMQMNDRGDEMDLDVIETL
jgi:hypothetical protein